jgi:hypothetical protein
VPRTAPQYLSAVLVTQRAVRVSFKVFKMSRGRRTSFVRLHWLLAFRAQEPTIALRNVEAHGLDCVRKRRRQLHRNKAPFAHSRRIVPISRSQKALACGALTGVFRMVNPIAMTVRSTSAE